MLIPKENRIRDKKYRKWIASLPCCISGVVGMTQAAHIRHGCLSAGMKPCDSLCVPLSYIMHDRQHKTSELSFWSGENGIERAKQLAKRLYEIRFNTEQALIEIARFRIDLYNNN